MVRKLYFDGASREGKATAGFLVEGLLEGTADVPAHLPQTSVVAEYMGLIIGLEKAIDLGISSLEVLGDSRIVLSQVTGETKVRTSHLKPLKTKAVELMEMIPLCRIRWVERGENQADRVSRW